ncbi:hypothetical protein [Chitinophaga sancti]|uniref:Carboxypeptidase regulatory-like domain-containing protein n=1 Tax=Chitinophaga sancti TaxID=1004 RepID=A0A1K1MIA8_9BACT|nr:hypothetical protein [Chitinophaga sancti]WQD62715.1 hypothetical protein U0033_32995 [Chitinophaga sancti]WQG91661.1 hypothetical protein SR876_09110 [Chitinophaga sancti]SFW22879.1 hypothetical protein SAMN05661012_00603 [Chitinophaga sancti]
MCYLLIGNVSALISADCTEPLINARIRVYLPDGHISNCYPHKYTFSGPRQLTPSEVLNKEERLLAETALDHQGNFSLCWEQVHLFTEPLELDICLQGMPEEAGEKKETHFHLSTLVPPWKHSMQRYVAAYAYVFPVESWAQIRASYGTWVIAGIVRRTHDNEGQSQLRVKAYNAGNHRMLACSSTDDRGRYQMRFSRKQLSAGQLLGPNVYFKVYRDKKLLWAEQADVAAMPGRRAIDACSVINITMQGGMVKKAAGWLSRVVG